MNSTSQQRPREHSEAKSKLHREQTQRHDRITQGFARALVKTILLTVLAISSQISTANELVDKALAATARGDTEDELKIWEQLANSGDADAMVAAGTVYQGEIKTELAYQKALDWYLKAKTDDALNNMGVMYRDGTGVPKNRKIAYLLFLTVHMSGNSAPAITRANQNLRQEMAELSTEQLREALCYTTDYLKAYIESKGKIAGIPQDLRAESDRKRFKDLGWWQEGEISSYDCSAES
jgi:hypothetical protein